MIGLDTNVLARYYVEDGAGAMHHASYRECERVASFDDRRFARRVQRSAMLPSVFVPR